MNSSVNGGGGARRKLGGCSAAHAMIGHASFAGVKLVPGGLTALK
jgi:hypothetical protein